VTLSLDAQIISGLALTATGFVLLALGALV
jgi:hypothetical protein